MERFSKNWKKFWPSFRLLTNVPRFTENFDFAYQIFNFGKLISKNLKFFQKLKILPKIKKFSRIENFFKNRKLFQKSKTKSKIEILARNRKLFQKSKTKSKIEILAINRKILQIEISSNRNLGQKSNFVKNRNFGQKFKFRPRS